MTFPCARSLAVVLIVVCAITFATPARAEADVLTTIAIVTLVVIGVMIVAYLVIANVAGSRQVEDAPPVWVACLSCAPYEAFVPGPVVAQSVERP